MLCTTDMEDTEEEMSGRLVTKQQNDKPQSSGDRIRSKQPTNRGNRSLPYTLKWVNGMKNFECKTCRKAFSFESQFDRHLLTHTGERPFQCKICKKRFARVDNLKKHLVIHTGEQPFSCQVCGKSFPQNSHLKRHQVEHKVGKKSYWCLICKRRFNQLGNFKRHLRTHTDERPFNCHLCRKSFTDISNHQKHLRLHREAKCVPSSHEKLTPTNSNNSNVEGNYFLF